jgi:hypothetical protein
MATKRRQLRRYADEGTLPTKSEKQIEIHGIFEAFIQVASGVDR